MGPGWGSPSIVKTRRYFRIGATIIVVSVCLPSESGLGGRRGRGGVVKVGVIGGSVMVTLPMVTLVPITMP